MLLITINFVFCGLAGGNNSNNIIILSVAVADDEEASFLLMPRIMKRSSDSEWEGSSIIRACSS
jgi:hypothetical protein